MKPDLVNVLSFTILASWITSRNTDMPTRGRCRRFRWARQYGALAAQISTRRFESLKSSANLKARIYRRETHLTLSLTSSQFRQAPGTLRQGLGEGQRLIRLQCKHPGICRFSWKQMHAASTNQQQLWPSVAMERGVVLPVLHNTHVYSSVRSTKYPFSYHSLKPNATT